MQGPHPAMLDFPIAESGKLSSAVRGLGPTTFARIAEHIRMIPYGRVEMSERNTPGVGRILAAAGVHTIPEAHCYLTYQAKKHDFTGLEFGAASQFDSLMDECNVAPAELLAFRGRYHRAALARCAASIGFDPQRAWQLRERCIAELARRV